MKYKIPIILIFFVLVLFLIINTTQKKLNANTGPKSNDPIVLTDSKDNYLLGPHLQYLEDKGGTILFQTILDDHRNKKKLNWLQSNREFLLFGFTSSVYWVKFDVVNMAKEINHWSLSLDYPLLDYIDLYVPLDNGKYIHKSAGDNLPFYKREIIYRNFLFPISSLDQNKKTFFIRVKTTSSMNIPLKIISPLEQSRKISNEQILLGIYYGVILVIAFYNLFLFISIRDVNYIYYIAWITSYGMYQIILNGLAFQYFWPELIWWGNKSLVFFIFLGTSFSVQFGRHFLRTFENNPIWDKLLISLMVITSSGVFLSLILPYAIMIKIGTALVIVMVIFMIIVGAKNFINGYRAARFYVLAFTTLFIGVAVFAIKSFGLLPSNFFTNWSQQIGSSMEVILLSFALADKINIMKRDKKIEEKEKIKAQKKYKRLIEDTNDMIFSMDKKFNILSSNNAVKTHLKINPAELAKMNFFDLIYEKSGLSNISKKIVQEKLLFFVENKEPIIFKTEFKTTLNIEAKEFNVKMEFVDIDDEEEILVKAWSVSEDSLLENFINESQCFNIGNHLYLADEISHRLTKNLKKFIDSADLKLLRMALREVLINSIEHGNLGITYKEKTDALQEDKYFELLNKRQLEGNSKDKSVTIEYSADHEKVIYKISDQGEGFDHEYYLEDSDRNNENILLGNHGRGIAIAKKVFDKIEYNNEGRTVILVKYF